VALGFQALFQQMEPVWIPRSIATAFLLIGAAIFVAAERRACRILARLHSHEVETVRVRNLRIITGCILAAVLALIAAIWTVEMRPQG
jgi:putative membrane protein